MSILFNKYKNAPYQGMQTEIVKVDYGLDGLAIELEVPAEGKSLSIEFDYVIGYRVLQESDLWSSWKDYNLNHAWIFEVVSGGWYDLENTRADFMSGKGNVSDYAEYLIVSVDSCVNVISTRPPTISESKCT